jgi:hypothetical protein
MLNNLDKILDEKIKNIDNLSQEAKQKLKNEILVESKNLLSEGVEEKLSLFVESQHKLVEELNNSNKVIIEQKDKELKVLKETNEKLIEDINQNVEVINNLTEEVENLSTNFQSRLDEQSKKYALLEDKLIESEVENHVYKLLREKIDLRPFCDKLLESKSKKEVDTKVEAFENAAKQLKEGVLDAPQGKGLATKEVLEEHFQDFKVNKNSKLNEKKVKEKALAGIKETE